MDAIYNCNRLSLQSDYSFILTNYIYPYYNCKLKSILIRNKTNNYPCNLTIHYFIFYFLIDEHIVSK